MLIINCSLFSSIRSREWFICGLRPRLQPVYPSFGQDLGQWLYKPNSFLLDLRRYIQYLGWPTFSQKMRSCFVFSMGHSMWYMDFPWTLLISHRIPWASWPVRNSRPPRGRYSPRHHSEIFGGRTSTVQVVWCRTTDLRPSCGRMSTCCLLTCLKSRSRLTVREQGVPSDGLQLQAWSQAQ